MDLQAHYSLLVDQFSRLDRDLLKKEGECQAVLGRQVQLQQDLTDSKSTVVIYDKSQVVLQKLTEIARRDTLDKIAGIVTTAVQEIKDPTLSFRINYKLERNQPVAEFVIYDSKLDKEMGLLTSCGGTIVDIVELLTKASLVLKWTPTLSKVLILDETFKHISTNDRAKLGNFIKQLTEKLGLQIILVTHSTELLPYAHKAFQVSHNGQTSLVELQR